MHILLGNPEDPLCRSVCAVLEARNYPTHIIANPLMPPSRFAWRLDNEQSASQFVWEEEPPVPDDQITGVLVRSTGWIDPGGWQPNDLTYMQAETRAALLAWLWSLACPVVNRYCSAIWYGFQASLLFWHPMLRRCCLPTSETLVTNIGHEARAFGRSLTLAGVAGAVYGPLTSDLRYLLTGEEDWNGLTAMQRYMPVCLTSPHSAAQFVCVVGERVIWEGEPSSEMSLLEPALRRFALLAGLALVELALAPASNGISVIAVEPYLHFERFGDVAQQQIVEGIVELLTAEAGDGRFDAVPTLQRSRL
ncbi:MAG: hypothetical protein V7641_3423 [Blastocatellia bacterium]